MRSKLHGLRSPLAFSSLFALVSIAGCGSPAPTDSDAGSDGNVPRDAAPACHVATDCDDGLFCNGTESCSADGRCVLGTPMRCDDGVACTTDACSEELRRCVFRVPDADGDGAGAASCLDATGTALGTDCADDDANRYPGNREVCDAMMHDEDCDATTHGGVDADGDGDESATCCNGTDCGTDCNDGRRDIHPGSTEVCNLVDDDCDGHLDEGVTIDVYTDADHDGDGAASATVMHACASTAGVSVYHTDCDDADATRSGRLIEVCDSIDNDCDTVVDDHTSDVTWYRDGDGDGFGSAGSGTLVSCIPPMGYSLFGTDCDDTTNTRSPARAEICDGIDDDCNGAADFALHPGDLEDDDGDGIADLGCGMPYGHDCDDHDPNSSPGTPETCDGRDNDCDTMIDEDATTSAFFRDVDGDGYGSEASGAIVGCVPSAGFVRLGGDCDDASTARHPGGLEGCNALDDDCDGAIDEGSASAMCSLAHTQQACVAGYCTTVACVSGYGDCTTLTPGCETNVGTDAANCGHCGTDCGSLGACSAGACVSLPTFGLLALYDARATSSLVMGAGTLVTGWHDVSGSNADLVVYDGMPMLRANGINGHPAIDFTAAGMVSPQIPLASDVTVFLVIQQHQPDNWGSYAHHGNHDYDWALEESGDQPLTSGSTNFQSSSAFNVELTLALGTNYVLVGRITGNLREYMAISSAGTTMASGMPSTITPHAASLYVGGSDSHEHSNVVLGELVYYQRSLSDAERDAVIAYLRAGWGI